MAEEQIVTNIVAKSDFSNLISDLNKVSSALINLQSKLNATNKNLAAQAAVMNRSFAETMRSTGQYSTHFVSLSSDVDKFGTQLDKGQIKLKQFAQVYQSHIKTSGGLVRELAKQQVQLQNAILQPLGKNAEGLMQYNVQIPTGLDAVKNKSALARQELQIMNKVIQEGANQLINWGKNTQWAGRQLTVGLTLPLAAFGKASADAFRQADQELVRLTKVYGGLAATSAQDLAKIRVEVSKTAADLSKSYGSSFKDTISLAADIAATGKQGNELLGSIKETTRLAVLGEVDRQDAMKATLAIQTAFKQNTEQLSESINFLNAVENQTSTTLNDLVEAIPKAGPIIQGLGGSIQDLALYLTAMREGGINATEGANALKSGLASLINPTKVAKDMFTGFGISLTDIVEKNAGNTTATILELQSALETLNPLQKQQALEQLFGKFQFARMNALFENLGKQGSQTLQVMDLMKASSQDLANIAGRELSQVTESASGKYRRALEGLKADLAQVGDKFLAINTVLINLVDGILKFVGKLPGPVKTILSLFGGLTALAGPMIMLTGVLANFFGYIVKGISHFKALAKGGEGWKLLTPEILAANKAGSLVEQTFYSDAKAAEILTIAVNRLSASYDKLALSASEAIISTNPAVSTAGGSIILGGKGPRVTDPQHPFVGPPDTRAAAHSNPVGLMTTQQKGSQTIHSVTPNPELVNQKIGKAPQIFTYGDMPDIPGLTTRNGVSTGIVAGEAAKWHSLMAALSMQTKQEVNLLKKEVATTGTVSQEFLSTYSTILPAMTSVIDKAVAESQLLIRQVQAGELKVKAAQAKLMTINAQLEADMAATTTMMASQMSRTANLNTVPLTTQAIVEKSGKSNLREIFRPERGPKKLLDAIARATGVKTWGGGYSIETTVPKKFATGGTVVPGPRSDTTDTQYMDLQAGDFVLNRKATDNLLGFNNGGIVPAMVTPGELIVHNPSQSEINKLEAYNNQFATGGRVKKSKNNYGINDTRNRDKPITVGVGKARGNQAISILSEIEAIADPELKKRYQNILSIYLKNVKHNKTKESVLGPEYLANTTGFLEPKNIDYLNRLFRRAGLPSLNKPIPLHDTHLTQRLYDLQGNPLYSDYTVKYSQTSNLQANKGNLNPANFISRDLRKIPGINKYEKQLKSAGVAKAHWDMIEQEIDKSIKSFFQNESARLGVPIGKLPLIGDEVFGRNGYTFESNVLPIIDTTIESLFPGSTAKTKYKKLKERKITARSVNNNAKDRYSIRNNTQKLSPMVGLKNPIGPGNYNPAALGPNPANYAIEAHGRNTDLGSIVRKIGGKYLTPHAIRMGAGRPKGMYTYTPTPKNNGGLVGYNSGGVVGGIVRRNKNNYGIRSQKQIPVTTTPRILFDPNNPQTLGSPQQPRDYQGSMMAGFGMQAAGSMIGGGAGNALMMGGLAMQFAPMLSKLASASNGIKSFSQLFVKLGSIGTKVISMLGNAFKFLMGPIGGPLAIATALVAVFFKLKQRATEFGAANRLAFGGTEKSFASVGITKYKSLEDRLKAVNDQMELNKAKAQSIYNAYTKSGPTGITLSIEELNKAIENAKKNQKDYVEGFNKINSDEVVKYAADLKAQFVAMGLSAVEASNQIYGIIKASDKAYLALKAVSSSDFTSIIDQTTALTRLFNNLSKAATVDNFNAEEFKTGLDTLINSMIMYQQGLVGTKDALDPKNIVDEADALQKTMEKITGIKSAQVALDSNQIDKLKEQSVVYASILSDNETLSSITAKILLYNSQMGAYLDFSKMTAADSITMATNFAKVQNGINAITESDAKDNPLAALAAPINKATNATKNYTAQIKAAQKADQNYYKDKIAAINEVIKRIEAEADARIKALQKQQDSENVALEIQKKQLEYQDALAAGNMDAAAAAQLDIKQLLKEKQYNDTVNAIKDKENSDVEKNRKEAERLAKEEDSRNKALNKVVQQNNETTANLTELKSLRDNIESASIAYRAAKSQNDVSGKNAALGSAIVTIEQMKNGSKEARKAYEDMLKQYGVKASEGPGALAYKVINALNNKMSDAGVGTEFKTAVEMFDKAVKDFAGKTDTASKTKDNPLNVTGKYKTNTVDGDKFQSPDMVKRNNLKANDYVIYNNKKYQLVSDNLFIPVAKAMGGRVAAGREYRVGERGEELFRPDVSGTIYPNPKTAPKLKQPDNKNKNWFQNYVSSLSKSNDEAKGILDKSKLTSWMSSDPLGAASLLRKFAGQGRPGDTLSAALMPLNFAGMGAGKGLTQLGSKSVGATKGLSADTIKSLQNYDITIKDLKRQILDVESGKYFKDNPWVDKANKEMHLNNLNSYVEQALQNVIKATKNNIPVEFLPALSRYIQMPRFAQGSDFDTIATATSRSSAFSNNPLYRALSANDMAKIVGHKEFPSPSLKHGLDWMKEHGYPTMEPSPWSNLTKLGDKALKIGESWIPDMHKSVTPSLEWAKDIAINGGTSGGSNKAIAKFITSPSARGITNLSGIADFAGSGKYPGVTEGLLAPWSKYVLKEINTFKHNFTNPKNPNVTHLIDEYVFQVIGQNIPKDWKPFGKLTQEAWKKLYHIPKFENGINSVPVDMLAQLHANEAVIPANMNPFNPNANNATMGSTYNFAPTINAAPGMDVKELGDVIIKRFEASVGLKTAEVGRNKNLWQ